MSLRGAPLLYIFLDVYDLDRQRELLEDVVGLPLIEVEPHLPHHRHGVVKYDAGAIVHSLNLSSKGKFRPDSSDALVTVVGVGPGRGVEARLDAYGRAERRPDGTLFTDPCGHHYLFRSADPAGSDPMVDELRLAVDDLDASVAWYGEVLGLELDGRSGGSAYFNTGSVQLVLQQAGRAADGRRLRRQVALLVFYVPRIEEAHDALAARGLELGNKRPAYSEIGGTSRFDDPSGNRFCLYEPSDESLGWGSGSKVLQVAAGRAAVA